MSKFKIPQVLIVDGPNSKAKKDLLLGLSEVLNGQILYLENPVFDREFKHKDVDECIDQLGHINLTMFEALTDTLGIKQTIMDKRTTESTRRIDYDLWYTINRNPCNALDYELIEDKENPLYSSLTQEEYSQLEVFHYTYRPCYLCVTEHTKLESVKEEEGVTMYGLERIVENLKAGLKREHYDISYSVMLMASQKLYLDKGDIYAGVFG